MNMEKQTINERKKKHMAEPISNGEYLKDCVALYYGRVAQENALFKNASKGEIKPQQFCEFLDNIFYLIQHTPIFLRLAQRVCLERKQHELAEFFNHKIDEEFGHENWATADLLRLEKLFGVKATRSVNPHMRLLVDTIKQSIETDPRYYLGYILLAEYFTVIATPSWLKDLEVKCGIPINAATVMDNHAELDKEHVIEMVDVVNRFVPELEKRSDLSAWFERFEKNHFNFCHEMGNGTHGN